MNEEEPAQEWYQREENNEWRPIHVRWLYTMKKMTEKRKKITSEKFFLHIKNSFVKA